MSSIARGFVQIVLSFCNRFGGQNNFQHKSAISVSWLELPANNISPCKSQVRIMSIGMVCHSPRTACSISTDRLFLLANTSTNDIPPMFGRIHIRTLGGPLDTMFQLHYYSGTTSTTSIIILEDVCHMSNGVNERQQVILYNATSIIIPVYRPLFQLDIPFLVTSECCIFLHRATTDYYRQDNLFMKKLHLVDTLAT